MKIEIGSKKFGEKIIFNDFSITIPDGEVTLIMGESGRGKTTLLRMMAGLDMDYIGHIDNRDAVLLFQDDRLVENMSLISNMMLVTDDREKAREILTDLGLGGEKESIVSSLSGGMKRRAAVARLLLLERDVYLLDEPFTGLDEETKRKTAEVINKRTEGRTLVIVSHSRQDGILLGASSVVDL